MNNNFYLTLMLGPNKPVVAPQSVIEALTAVEVTVSSGQTSGFQLSFATGKRSQLAQSLLPSSLLDPKVRVIIMVTLRGTMEVLMDGVITQQQLSPANEPGQSTLSVTGEDLTRMMDLNDRTGKENYPSQSAAVRVQTILQRYREFGVMPELGSGTDNEQPNPQRITHAHRGTDLQYLNELASDAGHVFYLEPGPAPGMSRAYWGPEIKNGAPQPALTLNMDAHANVESLNFSYNGFSKTDFLVDVLDEGTGEPRTVTASATGASDPILGERKISALRNERLSMTGKYASSRAAAAAKARAAQTADAISASGQLDVLRYGHILKARKLVNVRGVGATYDGLYYVKSVTHNIKRGEYKQSFTLSRNALKAKGPTVPV